MKIDDQRMRESLVSAPLDSPEFGEAFNIFLELHRLCHEEQNDSPNVDVLITGMNALRERFRDETSVHQLMDAVGPCEALAALDGLNNLAMEHSALALADPHDVPFDDAYDAAVIGAARAHIVTCAGCAEDYQLSVDAANHIETYPMTPKPRHSDNN